ncbi:MAG: hypothetical protein JXA53_06070 [Bacteroidales bacterium]|nr:hypothetical protein [Bacteroidales bacterium]
MHNYKFIIYLTVLFFSFQLKGQDCHCRSLEAAISNKTFIEKFNDCLKGDTILLIDTAHVFSCSYQYNDKFYKTTDKWPENFNINTSFGSDFDNQLFLFSYLPRGTKVINIVFISPSTHLQLVFECIVKRKKVKVKLVEEGQY